MFRIIFFIAIIKSIISATPLYETREWKTLFHVRDKQKSDITDSKFYLSSEHSMKSEYDSALFALQTEKRDEIICQYPARYRFLNNKLNLGLTFDSCENLQNFLNDSRGESASITFASSYLSSPMSYFGHSFITINKKNNRFFSQTISFAAEVPKNTQFMELAYKGISGGFVGKFVAAPYFKLYEGYNLVEQRSLTEYQLNLSANEIENLLWHAYELFGVGVEYKFFTNNCAYETLWLLEAARPKSEILENFDSLVVPYETIVTTKKIFYVQSIETQPALLDSLYAVYGSLTDDEKKFFVQLKDADNKSFALETSNLSIESKDKIGYLINGYYDVLFKKFNIGKSDFDDVKKIPYKPVHETYSGEPNRHGGSKIEFGFVDSDIKKSSQYIKIQPFSFEKRDERYSLLGDGTLNILNFEVQKHDNNFKLASLELFKVESLSKRFDFYTPASWKFEIGADRYLKPNSLQSYIRAAIGAAYGTNNSLFYCLGQIDLYPTALEAGFGTLLGWSYWMDNLHFGVDYQIPILYTNALPHITLEGYATYQMGNNVSIKTSIEADRFKIGFNYLF